MLAWGKRVSVDFCAKVKEVSSEIEVDPSFLMACMAFETGATFSPSIMSGAVGLIQFMPSTALALGTDTETLSNMTAINQLDYVAKYFMPRRGSLHTLSDVYMAILWPVAIGKPETYVLFDKNDPLHPNRYIQNAGLDFNRDGVVTKAEAAARVQFMLDKGNQAEYAGP
ncbi:MAG: lytic transglycosylase [Pseudomonas sp.]|nr:lytic transglycosylase [Pseudomonas sp.]